MFDITYELCPFCESEVKLKSIPLGKQPCPICNELIAPCSLCNNNNIDCINCSLITNYIN